jgi:hypothetical protein
MLNLCIALARLPRVHYVDVELLCYMAGELTRLGAHDAAIAEATRAMERRLTEAGSDELSRYHSNRRDEVTAPGWQPSRQASDVLRGQAGLDPDPPASLGELDSMLAGEGNDDDVWPELRVAERAIHSAQLALDAGDSRMAFAFAAAAVAAMDCDSGNGIGDMDEIPEALGVLLARIAVAD